MSTVSSLSEVLTMVGQIEQLVENGKGWMGKRVVNEEEFFTQIQRLRAALQKAIKEADDATGLGVSVGTAKPVRDFLEESSLLSRQEQMQIVAALSARLARE